MKLIIGPNITDNKVRLDFRNSPDKPNNVPSFEIENSKADEFVKEYNSQSEKLHKVANTIMGISGIVGVIASSIILFKSSTKKVVKALSALVASLAVGAIASAKIASDKKNELMDKYKVYKHIQKS